MTNKLMKLEDVEKELQSPKWSEGLSLYKTGKNLDIFLSDVVTAFTIGQNADDLKNSMTTGTGRASVFYALTHAAQTGLSLNPALGEARLATYWNKDAGSCTVNVEIDKAGYVKLATMEGCTVVSDLVKENDTWEVKKTFDGDEYTFSPARKDRGNLDGVFCAIRERNGKVHVKYMTVTEVEEHRDKYARRNKQGEHNTIWQKSFPEMCLKTVIKMACKSLNIGQEPEFAEPVPSELPEAETMQNTPTEKLLEEIKKRADEESACALTDGKARF